MPSPRLRRLLSGATIGAVAATGIVVAGPASGASAEHGKVEPGRRIVQHTVRPGDTATGLAVRYRAWTAELIAHNHLGSSAALRVGDRIEIPVVVKAGKGAKATKATKGKAKAKGKSKAKDTKRPAAKKKPAKAKKQSRKPRKAARAGKRERRYGVAVPRAVPRPEVRRIIARTAKRRGVDPNLALAVAWQESGWQMDVVSSAQAIGAMQVLPATSQWMEYYVGRSLRPGRVRDNVDAGVELLRFLGDNTGSSKHQIAAYYQGLGAVREHGLYDETKPYVKSIKAIKRRLESGRPPS